MNINATLFGEMITFLLFIWFTMKFVWPPVMKATEDRQKKIADGLEAAERSQQELKLTEQKSIATLREAKQNASGLIDQANNRASQIVEEAKGTSRKEAKKIIVDAHQEIDQSVKNAKENLQATVAQAAIASAEKILEKEIDQASHDKLIEKLIAEI